MQKISILDLISDDLSPSITFYEAITKMQMLIFQDGLLGRDGDRIKANYVKEGLDPLNSKLAPSFEILQ